ncbi:MAG TPA: aminoglycoside phosphotransferase family protein [Candidatus Acidoferrales bacterium]|nr:aminoglycoside phosphotransferase family protein [Candidatus Acidoferrales bacterium]
MAESDHGVDVAALLDLINTRHGTAFTLKRGTGLGESGASYFVTDASGEQCVLKFGFSKEFEPAQAAEFTRRLLDVGYPAPRYQLFGEAMGLKYSIQTRLPGKPWQAVTRATLDRVLAINHLQAGLAAVPTGEPFPPWPARVVEGVLVGFERYCVIDSLRRHSDASAALLGTLQELVARRAGEIPAAHDIVHWDFHRGNILTDGGRVTGVVDWEGACTGDRGFDLATYLFYSFEDIETRELLWREALECSGRSALSVYLAHMIVRQLDWSIRHHNPKMVDEQMARAEAILRALAGV